MTAVIEFGIVISIAMWMIFATATGVCNEKLYKKLDAVAIIFGFSAVGLVIIRLFIAEFE